MKIQAMTTLQSLGSRICIFGPSNSGKSTLAQAISRKCGLPVVHLDQLFHLPHTDWLPRPEADFLNLHAAAIRHERWVMEGNYSRCMPERLERATGLILLDTSTATSLMRYLRRTCFERERAGALDGGKDSLKWEMIRHITTTTLKNRQQYARIFEQSGLPKIRLESAHAGRRFYGDVGLSR